MTTLSPKLSDHIADLYRRMEAAYDRVAQALSFSCRDCPDNCCDSYFQHHTYIEWAYLTDGLAALPAEKQQQISERAAAYIRASEAALGRDERPAVLCPLNEDGLCILYTHRLMICRMHGVPSSFTRPDGKSISSPGCFVCQKLVEENPAATGVIVDRTELYRELAGLEALFLGVRRKYLPRVKLTLAEMIVTGFPGLK